MLASTPAPQPSRTTASAPGKIILFGEHAVVYGRPAIAVPVGEVTATVTVRTRAPNSGCLIIARDLNRTVTLADAPGDEPLALAVRLVLADLDLPPNPDWQIEVRSQIPIASGLGSGAAVSTALVRALFRHAGHEPSPAQVSRLVYRTEEVHHGTPSGIDNTVVAYERPVWFVRGEPIQTLSPTRSFTIAIADSGISSPTRETVGDVRRAWQQAPDRYEAIFDGIGAVVWAARRALEAGDVRALGPLMERNQTLLRALGVSSDPLEALIEAARGAGALGAKLSGGGRGGNAIALVDASTAPQVEAALRRAGAQNVIVTEVAGGG